MSLFFQNESITLYQGDSLAILKALPTNSIDIAITSPPYFNLCNYQVDGQIGLEGSIKEYLGNLILVFREVRRVLKEGSVFWVIIGDTQNNYSPIRGKGERRNSEIKFRRTLQDGYLEKEQLGIPFKLVDCMRKNRWIFRRELIWNKFTSGQQSNSDSAPLTHESIFQFGKWSKGGRPYFNCKSIPCSVIQIPTVSNPVHPCPYPEKLVEYLLGFSMKPDDVCLDPFAGSCTSLKVASNYGSAIGIELNQIYLDYFTQNLKVL